MGLAGFGAVGGISPDGAGGVALVQDRFELRTVMGGSTGQGELADEAVGTVDGDMVLVAVRPRGLWLSKLNPSGGKS